MAIIPIQKDPTRQDIYDFGFSKSLSRGDGKRSPIVYDAIRDAVAAELLAFGSTTHGGSNISTVAGSPAFGGDGSDGHLSITSGTTTISFASANILVRNYKSLEISGTGVLAFSNPATNGSTFYARVQGDVTLTSTTNPAVDLRNLGGAGGAGGAANAGATQAGSGGGGGASVTANGDQGTSSGGGAGAQNAGGDGTSCALVLRTFGGRGGDNADQGKGVSGNGGNSPLLVAGSIAYIRLPAVPGAGGGGGGGAASEAGGAGGRGAGAIVIECGGRLRISSTLNAAGTAGSNTTGNGGAGAGGAGGAILIIYNDLISNTGTLTVTGGAGGTGSGSGGDGGAGAAGLGTVVQNNTFL